MARARKRTEKNSLRSLSINLYAHADRIEKNVGKAIKLAGYAAHTTLVYQTPIDTGQAKSNWKVSVGTPDLKNIGPHVPGEYGSTSQQNIAATLAEAWKVLSKYDLSQGDLFIANGLPYIIKLNEGWSQQAPAGFIQKAVQRITAEIAGIKYLSEEYKETDII